MNIRCGNCKQTHGTVNEVRKCYGLPDAPHMPLSDVYAPNPIREREIEQQDFLRPQQPPQRPVVNTDGMYRHPKTGDVYKVQKAVHGSGRLYAKRLVVSEVVVTDDNGQERKVPKGSFVYAPGAISELAPEDKMSLEDAQKFGRLYGVCCKCGATLTDDNSIDAGIGPVCAKKGW